MEDLLFHDYDSPNQMTFVRVHLKLSQQQVVGGDTNHGPASAGVPTGRNRVRRFEMHPFPPLIHFVIRKE